MKKKLLVLISSFCLVFLLVYVMNGNLTFATDSNSYYASELKVGDIIPVNSSIMSDVKYYYISNPDNVGFVLSFLPSESDTVNYDASENYYSINSKQITGCFNYNDKKLYYENGKDSAYCVSTYGANYFYSSFSYWEIFIYYGASVYGADITTFHADYGDDFVVPSYSELYETDDSFDADSVEYWVVAKINTPYVFLKPADKTNYFDSVPSVDNNYESCFVCEDASTPKYYWYKYSEINDYNITNATNGNKNFEWQIENGFYSVKLDTVNSDYSDSTLSFTFDAKKDDVLVYSSIYNSIGISADLGEVNLFNNVSSYSYGKYFFSDNNHVIENDGSYNLDFTVFYPYSYSSFSNVNVSLKKPFLLTLLNEGNTLDQSLVNDGDTLYYESVCDNGYKMGSVLTYKEPSTEEEEEIKNEDNSDTTENDSDTTENNPNTFSGNMILLAIALASVSITIALFSYNKKQTLN